MLESSAASYPLDVVMLGVTEEREEDHGEQKFFMFIFDKCAKYNYIKVLCNQTLVRAHALLTLIVYCLCFAWYSTSLVLVNAVASKYVRNVCGLFI